MIDKMTIPPSQVSNGASLSNQGCKSWDNNYCTYRRSERSSDAADSLTSSSDDGDTSINNPDDVRQIQKAVTAHWTVFWYCR